MAEILENKQVGTDYYLMRLKTDLLDNSWIPGRFLHLKISEDRAHDPLLRRPFSLFDVDNEKKTISLLYCVVGRGTEIMTDFKPGREIDFIGPLGKGFTLVEEQKVLLVGGGMGTAPLFYLARQLVDRNQVTLLLGGNCCSDVDFFCDSFGELDLEIKKATMDGSRGLQGTVIDLWENMEELAPNNKFLVKKYDFLYSCGPEVMLAAVQEKARKFNIPGEVSLEKRMGCGIGVCLSCVCDTENGNQRVCKEGPVFDLEEVVLNE